MRKERTYIRLPCVFEIYQHLALVRVITKERKKKKWTDMSFFFSVMVCVNRGNVCGQLYGEFWNFSIGDGSLVPCHR